MPFIKIHIVQSRFIKKNAILCACFTKAIYDSNLTNCLMHLEVQGRSYIFN